MRTACRALCILIVLLLLIGSAGPTLAQMSDEQFLQMLHFADEGTLEEFKRGDAYAIAAKYWEDAIDVSPDGFFIGRPAIQKRFEELFRTRDPGDLVETIDQAHVDGDRGWFVGHCSLTYAAQTGEMRASKGYVAAMLEHRNGEWKAVMHLVARAD
jgi:ketosteroid isomerase-like protein